MEFLVQSFQMLDPSRTDRHRMTAAHTHTDRRDRTHYQAAFADGNKQIKF